MNSALLFCLAIALQALQSNGMTLQVSAVPLRRISAPITVPMARQTVSTNLNIPNVSTLGVTDTTTGSIFPGTQTTVGTAGLDVVRRGSELIADRIASALGGIAVLVDVLRNTSVNGDVVWANIGSSTQALASRLLTIGMNTANTLLQDLSGQLALNGNPSTVLQSFLTIPNIEQLGSLGAIGSFSRTTPVSSQISFANGRPGLSVPTTTNQPSAGSVSDEVQNINTEVETFLGNLSSNDENSNVNP